jgi:hypothetical protein
MLHDVVVQRLRKHVACLRMLEAERQCVLNGERDVALLACLGQ